MLKIIKEERGIPTKIATLCFLLTEDSILLAMKKRGFGEGKWNGVGGKVEENESIEQAIIREAFEEVTVQPIKPKHQATINFYFSENNHFDQQVHAFIATNWNGTPQESEEMMPAWFDRNRIPWESMWNGDDLWIPHVLDGKFVEADLLFGTNENVLDTLIHVT